jgi:hypothetical protein
MDSEISFAEIPSESGARFPGRIYTPNPIISLSGGLLMPPAARET